MIQTAVIIAGGEGSRLMPLTQDKPKAMAPISGEPMIRWVIRWLKLQGIRNLVVGVAYKKEKIIDYLQSHSGFGLNVTISEHTLEGGTAQGFNLAISRYVQDENFLAMNCDEITNLSVDAMWKVHSEKKSLVTMALAPFLCRFSVVEVASSGIVTGFKYGHLLKDFPVSIGVYLFNRALLQRIPSQGSIEDLVFASLASEGKIAAYPLAPREVWVSVNDLKNVKEAEQALRTLYPTL